MAADTDAPGIATRLSSLIDGVLGMLQTRLSLLAVEVEEEGIRLGAALFNLILAALFLGFGLFSLAILLTVWLWDSHRLLVIGVCVLVFLGLSLWTASNAYARLHQGKRLFTDSIAELRRDRDALSGEE